MYKTDNYTMKRVAKLDNINSDFGCLSTILLLKRIPPKKEFHKKQKSTISASMLRIISIIKLPKVIV